MKISFVVIAYNEEKNIGKCIRSIIAQNRKAVYEIIIVNDGSTDKTKERVIELMRKHRNIKLVDLKINKGRGFARFEGVNNSSSEIIAFVDGDIILPLNWSMTCLDQLDKYDAVGGIALPDGDVTFIQNQFGLTPKIKLHTTELTGNNCMFKKKIFETVQINKNIREGEDVDLVWRIKNAGYRLKTINNLIVKHNESKSYIRSLQWLFQSGIGATKLLLKYKKVRMPDITFFIFLILIITCLILSLLSKNSYYLIMAILYPLIVSLFHIKSKFYFGLNNSINILGAVIMNYPLIFLYFIGRFVGLFLLL